MNVFVNNEITTLAHNSKLDDLLHQIGLQEKTGIAVAVNELIIAKHQWQQCHLNENDKILIITATQGG